MCYVYGSLQVTTSVCPMCKFFKPSARCPHKHDVCKNSALHPRHDIVHMRNAEVQTFNGCGYCKWARTNPQARQAGPTNPGWPGCCRKPESGESRLIPPADWPAVSTVHNIPVPPEVKILLESISAVASKSSVGNSALVPKTTSSSVLPPPLDRRSSASAVPSRPASAPRTQPLAIPAKSRSNGSPKESVTSLTGGTTRAPLRDSPPTSNPSLLDFGPTHHRKTSVDNVEKRGDSPNTPSPLRRSIELERAESSRSATRRSSVTKATSASVKSPADRDTSPVLRRRASITESPSPSGAPPVPIGRALERRETISASRPNIKKSSLEIDFNVLTISGGGASKSPISAHSDSSDSSSQSGSSDGTITSDGAFTDYLSDESEAELQKQAEAKAALLAQTHAEEKEFKAARQQLANVDLRPPKSWGAGNGTGQMTPRSQDQVYSVLSTSSYTTHTRGQVDAVGVGRAR